MAVVAVTTLQIKPGRMEDYIDYARNSKILMAKVGLKNIRLLSGVIAGEATGSVVLTAEADDFAAAGAILDKMLVDPEGAAMFAAANAADGPVASYQTSEWVDIPL